MGEVLVRPEERDYTRQEIVVAGIPMQADRSGALFWPGQSILVVADMHLEKGSALAERGSFLPPYDTRTTLGRLARTLETYEPQTVVCLGDSLHDRRAAERLAEDDIEVVRRLQAGRDWIWVTGNHDPDLPEDLGGRVVPELAVGGLVLSHEPKAGQFVRQIAAHLHPAARVARHGYVLRRPCFIADARRLIMPAFGAYTGGLNILDASFANLFGDADFRVWVIGHEGIYPVAPSQLRAD
ncbi:MAG: ligase-associated DNA damage response endonuclease PdeM [Hyphomicrobiaceae bacterium]